MEFLCFFEVTSAEPRDGGKKLGKRLAPGRCLNAIRSGRGRSAPWWRQHGVVARTLGKQDLRPGSGFFVETTTWVRRRELGEKETLGDAAGLGVVEMDRGVRLRGLRPSRAVIVIDT